MHQPNCHVLNFKLSISPSHSIHYLVSETLLISDSIDSSNHVWYIVVQRIWLIRVVFNLLQVYIQTVAYYIMLLG